MDDMPKRRRSKDNPYILSKDEANGIYLVSFMDGTNTYKSVEITKEIYEAMDSFELKDLKQMNEYDNHIEHSEIFESTLNMKKMDKPISLEDSIILNATFEELRKAINKLPNIQRRRIIQYYFEGLNCYEIARREGIAHQVADRNIKKAISNLKNILKNFK